MKRPAGDGGSPRLSASGYGLLLVTLGRCCRGGFGLGFATPLRANQVDLAQDLFLVPAVGGTSQARLELAQLVLALIAAIQFGTTFDHAILPISFYDK